MSEQYLDRAQVDAGLEQMRGESMPARVRVNCALQARLARSFLHCDGDAGPGHERATVAAREQVASRTARLEVRAQRLQEPRAQQRTACAAALGLRM